MVRVFFRFLPVSFLPRRIRLRLDKTRSGNLFFFSQFLPHEWKMRRSFQICPFSSCAGRQAVLKVGRAFPPPPLSKDFPSRVFPLPLRLLVLAPPFSPDIRRLMRDGLTPSYSYDLPPFQNEDRALLRVMTALFFSPTLCGVFQP